ncbi:MAG: lamin tail domain-containing protein, partial [Bradymonadaceae bacterium]
PAAGTGCKEGETCSARGECVMAGDCLADSDCDEPPSPRCDGDTLQSYSGPGTCNTSGQEYACEYTPEETPCPHGCKDGECLPDPCKGKTCQQPPASSCIDENTLETYQTPGACESDNEGMCSYETVERSCAHGCMNGECSDGPCEAISCDSPPEDRCDENTAVTYQDSGTCEMTEDEGTKCDYAPTYENCSYTGATCESASCGNPIVQEGGLIVTEYMADPMSARDRDGEWFEVYNPSSSDIDLKGWTLASDGDDDHRIVQSVTVPAQGRALLGRESDPLDGEATVSPDYVYDSVVLSNNSDWLRLKDTAGNVVDHVFYEQGTPIDGHSRKLDPSIEPTVSANDDYTNWCPSLSSEESLGDGAEFGSPGAENPVCADKPCSEFTCETPAGFCRGGDAVRPTKDSANCRVSKFRNPYCDFQVKTFSCTDQELCVTGACEPLPSNLPGEGDLVITEMMGNPDAVSDTAGEWIEVYNPTQSKLSLFSIVIRDSESGGKQDTYTVVEKGAEIGAGSYAVFARNTDSGKNGGISGTLKYSGSHLKNSSDGMTISLVRQDGTVVDKAHYAKPKTGTAQQLSLSTYDGGSSPASANDDAANWCGATDTYGDGDLGTPGADNVSCQ